MVVIWDTANYSIIDNYTVSYINLCDNVKRLLLIENFSLNNITIDMVYPGLQYLISVVAFNTFGKGIEMNDSVILEGSGEC